ncbi:glycerophosphodiester phosphodiesterase family protein [Tomitella biformata]|uniref:glycerophosphodiester phosphodiesterase family protein n=1 Tax=Tomitella biformata TaxID=630403 RepID=UPI0004655C7B|nr:glycerophosphodiester phosphodiesterase family protein [Tomitella biformata]
MHPNRSRGVIAAVLAAAALSSVAGTASAAPLELGSLAGLGSLGSLEQAPPAASDNLPTGFDLQSHRGGRAETTEESRRAFEKSLDLDVTTLELDIVLSADNVPVVWHDPTIDPAKCADTAPAAEGDAQYPYVGDLVRELTWAQLQTLDCGKGLSAYPDAEVVEGNKLIQLRDVFALTAARGADVHFNIETKIEADKPEQSASPQEFVDAILAEVRAAGVTDKVMIQSFDWRSLPLVRAAEPSIPLVLLWSGSNWKPGSVWTGPVTYEEVDGDIVAAAHKVGVEVLSPTHTLATPELIARAHEQGLAVVPWTVNDPPRMNALMDAGVDGIITDKPTLLRQVMAERGLELPTAHPAK